MDLNPKGRHAVTDRDYSQKPTELCFEDDEPSTEENPALTAQELERSLSEISSDEILPVYLGPRKAAPERLPPPPILPAPPLEEAPPPLTASDDLIGERSEVSVTTEGKPIHQRPTVPLPQPFGDEPLDFEEFTAPAPRRKRKRRDSRPPVITTDLPPPMEESQRVVRHRFVFTGRDLVLLVLALVFAAGILVAWHIYQDYRSRAVFEKLALPAAATERIDPQNNETP